MLQPSTFQNFKNDPPQEGESLSNLDQELFLKTLFAYDELYLLPEGRTLPRFSFFKRPISNKVPYRDLTILDVYKVIKGKYYVANTLKWREGHKRPKFKENNFDYVTFSGTFVERGSKSLIQHSGYLCIDLDHLANMEHVRQTLINDTELEPDLLFTSPSGDGLKLVTSIDISRHDHKIWWRGVAGYLMQQLHLEADPSGKDCSRACFLPHDPEVFINSKYYE